MCRSCASAIRILMILFNVLFTIVGVALLTLALYFYFNTFKFRGIDEGNMLFFAYVGTAIIGALSIIMGVLGCCGSYHYSRCLLGLYFTLLLFIFAGLITVGVLAFANRNEVEAMVADTLKAGVEDLKKSTGKDFRWMEGVQVLFDCCGYNGWLDYMPSVPSSCCPDQNCAPDAAFKAYPGCGDRIMKNINVLLIIAICIAIVEFVGLIFAMVLCCAAGEREIRIPYHSVHAR